MRAINAGGPKLSSNGAYGNVRVPWHLKPAINIIGVIVTTVSAVTVGVVASWDVIVRKPATILREE